MSNRDNLPRQTTISLNLIRHKSPTKILTPTKRIDKPSGEKIIAIPNSRKSSGKLEGRSYPMHKILENDLFGGKGRKKEKIITKNKPNRVLTPIDSVYET